MKTLLFPRQLSEFGYFIRSALIAGAFVVFVFLWVNFCAKNLAAKMLIVELGLISVFLIFKAYHVVWVTAPRLRNIGLEASYAAFALIPFVSIAIFIGCCLAPAGWWQYVTCPQPPPLPGQSRPSFLSKERVPDEY